MNRNTFSFQYIVVPKNSSNVLISAMIGENLKPKKDLITKTNL